LRDWSSDVCSSDLNLVENRIYFFQNKFIGPQGFLPHWTNSILQQLKRNFWKIARAWARLGKPKQDFCLRFGLSVYRIFGSETEEGGPRAHHHLGLSCQIFVLGNARHSGEWLKDRKSV
jgi:hypothetical protein